MAADFTRRELAKLAGTGALMMSATGTIGLPTSATAVPTDMPRGRMGFTGTIVSDDNGVATVGS